MITSHFPYIYIYIYIHIYIYIYIYIYMYIYIYIYIYILYIYICIYIYTCIYTRQVVVYTLQRVSDMMFNSFVSVVCDLTVRNIVLIDSHLHTFK